MSRTDIGTTEPQFSQSPDKFPSRNRNQVYSTIGTGSADTSIVLPFMGGIGLSHPESQHYPALNSADKLFAAFFKGLAGSPYSLQSWNMCIIRLRIINYFIFCLFQGGCYILCEHIDGLLALLEFNSFLSFREHRWPLKFRKYP